MLPPALLLPEVWLATVLASLSSSGSTDPFFPSYTSLMSDIVLSRLRRRVLGLVIVVPRLAWRPCPRRKGDTDIDVGDVGEVGVPGPTSVEMGVMGEGGAGSEAMTSSRALATPLAETGSAAAGSGVVGWEDERIALPSSDDASKSSGGSRSFSISDLRLRWNGATLESANLRLKKGGRTHPRSL